jgi:hypothetical protein
MKKNRDELVDRFDERKEELITDLLEWLRSKDLTMFEARCLLQRTNTQLEILSDYSDISNIL